LQTGRLASARADTHLPDPLPARLAYSRTGSVDPFVLNQDGDGRAAIDRRRVGPFDAVRVTYHRHAATETLKTVAEGDCFIALQIAGSSVIGHGAHEHAVEASDVVLVDSSRPLRIRRSGRLVVIAVRVPAATMDGHLPDWRKRSCMPLDRGMAALIGALVRTAFEQVASGTGSRSAVASAILDLVAASDDEPDEVEPAPVPPIVRTIQTYLLGRLGDAELTPLQIARHHGLSERQLHRAFHAGGISLCRWLRQTRLDRCAAELADPAMSHRSITRIAFDCGFNDAAHFSRIFRAEFDCAPREYRAAAVAAARKS